MSSWLSVILILLILLVIGYLFLRKSNRLPNWLSGLSTANPTKTINKIESSIELEQKKAQELRAILTAKQRLAKARAINSALRREIASTHESAIIIPKSLLEEQGGKKEEKVQLQDIQV